MISGTGIGNGNGEPLGSCTTNTKGRGSFDWANEPPYLQDDYVEKDPNGRYVRGIKPASLSKVTDSEVKGFIEKCLVAASERLSANDLLKDPFLQFENLKESVDNPIQLPKQCPRSLSLSKHLPHSMDVNSEYNQSICIDSSCGSPRVPGLELQRCHQNNDFKLMGKKTDVNSISLTLRIRDPKGGVRNIHFIFYLETDTASLIAAEMVEQLQLADHDEAFIADFIDYLIMKIFPAWNPSSGDHFSGGRNSSKSIGHQDGTSHRVTFDSPTHLDNDKSQGVMADNASNINNGGNSFVCFDDPVNDGVSKSCSTNISEMDFMYLFHDEWTITEN
ncbi:hypothetical protein K7X08_023008 [Anisodus acutangulus]|uniref:non-specific serine/threonine protein kinase n=1 Tax=Anisodus acutangulus TaxID=402998 RepID=A0A9Q1RH88_9SOLA|nr:hypothetical protein K7X08_023008 [Anisodus acutangulus]